MTNLGEMSILTTLITGDIAGWTHFAIVTKITTEHALPITGRQSSNSN